MLATLVAVNVWLFGVDRTALTRAARQLPFHPDLFLLVTVLVIFSGFFHELGHATATRYGGGSPGVMGVGIYLAWPAFYTDLTDSYRLNRSGRLRSDLGGVYFNAVLIVIGGAAYLVTGFGPLAVFMVVSQAMAMYQFLPFIRLDGYYIMSDLVGVPNLFAYLGPVLKSTFRRPDPVTTARLNLLKRRARLAIKVWSIVTVVFLAFNFGGIAVMAPILIPEEWASIHLQGQALVAAFARESIALGVNDVIDLIIVAVAPVGMFLIAGILLRRAVRAIRRWWPTHPKVTADFAALLAGALLFQGQGLVGRLTASPASSGPKVVASQGARRPPTDHVPRLAAPSDSAAPSGPAAPSDSAAPSGPAAPSDSAAPSGPAAPSATGAPSDSAAPSVSSYAAPDRIYVVQPGDTLWTIAARELGDPEQWLPIFDLNAGRPQPGGRTLVDPDLIDPGWSLELPGSQPGATVIANPSLPVNTTDAVVARPFPLPHEPSEVSASAAVGPLPTSPTPPTSVAVSQPSQSPSRPVAPAADDTSPPGSAAEGTTGGAPMSSAQSLAPTTTTQTPTDVQTPASADQSKAPGPCGRRSLTCQSPPDAAGPQASPPRPRLEVTHHRPTRPCPLRAASSGLGIPRTSGSAEPWWAGKQRPACLMDGARRTRHGSDQLSDFSHLHWMLRGIEMSAIGRRTEVSYGHGR
jgi:LysM repeat protein